MVSIRRVAFAVGLFLVVAVACAGDALAAVRLDIKAQPMADALNQWAQATGYQVIFPEESATAKLMSPAVRGNYTPTVALAKLLANSGLRYEYLNERTVAVKAVAHPDTDPQSMDGAKEGKKSDSFRLAQATQGSAQGTATVAANAAAESGGRADLEEVIVTAQKKFERLQEVPVPITVLNGDSLAQSNQSRIQDYFTKVPGLNVTPLGESQVVSIRGITTGDYTNPRVAVAVDDVPFGPSQFLSGGLLFPDIDPSDLNRIEVLRGPQGTLYGATSLGGLIKFVTVDPATDRISARIQAGLSGIYNGAQVGYNVRGAVNVPLSDALAIRVSAFTHEDPGYIDNPVLNINGVNKTQAEGGRLAALWKLANAVSLKVSALYQESRRNGSNDVNLAPGLGDLQQNYMPGAGPTLQKLQAYSATLRVELGNAELVALTGYNRAVTHISYDDTDFLASVWNPQRFGVPGVFESDDITAHKLSQEVRLTTPLGPNFDWLAGVYYSHQSSRYEDHYSAANPATGQAAGLLDHFLAPTTYDEYAGFTDLTYKITERFNVQAGARESSYKEATGEFLAGALFSAPELLPTAHLNQNAFTYLLTPQYKVSPDLMVYARVASGFGPGGSNLVAGASGQLPNFGPDKTRDYEIGFKGNALNHQLSFDASVYYITWKDMQLTVVDPTTHFIETANAGAAKSQGVELSLEARPLDGLTVATWVSYDNAALTQDLPLAAVNAGTSGVAGDRLPDSSKWSGNLSLEQSFPLSGAAMGVVGGDLAFVGERLGVFQPLGLARAQLPAYWKGDVHAGLRYGPWAANLFINNIADKRGVVAPLGYFNATRFVYIQPRTIGVNLARTL